MMKLEPKGVGSSEVVEAIDTVGDFSSLFLLVQVLSV